MMPSPFSKSSRLALIIAILAALMLPAGYFALGYQKLAVILETEAEANGLIAAQIIQANPDFWSFEQARLQEFLTHHSVASAGESRRIINQKGNIVAWNQIEVSPPAITRSQALYESGNKVGALEISRSLRSLLGETIFLALLVSLLMAGIYVLSKKYVFEAREKAEKALRESEKKYRLLESNIPALVFNGYPDWRIDLFDDKVEELLGFSQEEFNSRRMTWKDVIVEEDLENITKIFIEALKSRKSYVREYRVRTKHGKVVWIQERSSIVCDQNGRLDYISGVLFDITQTRQAEEALKEQFLFLETLIDTIPSPVFYKSVEGVYLGCNQALSDFSGLPKEEIVGKTVYDLFPPDQADKYMEMDAALFRQPGVQVYDFTMMHADGTRHEVNFRKATYCTGDGKLAGLVGIMLDITRRKEAEEALKEQFLFLETLLDTIPNPIYYKNPEGRYLGCNQAFEKYFGITREEIVSKTVFDLASPKMAAKLHGLDQELLRQPGEQVYEARVSYANGSSHEVIFYKAPFYKTDGHLGGMVGVMLDITQRKEVEEALREVQSQQRALLDNIPDIAWLKDRESRYLAANEPFALSCGFSREELVGRTDFEFWPLELAIKYRQDDEEVMRSGQRRVLEEQFVGVDGKKIWIETIKTPVYNDQGEVIGTTGIAREFTARKQASDELRRAHKEIEQLFESIPFMMMGLSPDGRISHWNHATVKTLWADATPVWGEQLENYTLSWEWDKVHQGLADCQESGKPVRVDDIRYRRPDGKDGLLGITFSPIKGEEGRITGLILLGRDITEQRLLEAQLAQAQKLESIGQLAAGIAHEINTPIQYVGDNTRFLRDASQDLFQLLGKYQSLLEAAKEGRMTGDLLDQVEVLGQEVDLDYLVDEIPVAIGQSLEGVERVAKIVRAMKDFSHPGTAEKQAVDLNKAIENTITVARNEWKYVAEMVTDLDPALPLVPCYPDEFNQVILNMIINAAHAIAEVRGGMPELKGTITIQTRGNGNGVDILISDNGAGIPEEIRSKVFDPFFTTKEVGKGTGQGLAISHAVIVDKHGGTINFTSALNQGTTFRLHLPLGTEKSG